MSTPDPPPPPPRAKIATTVGVTFATTPTRFCSAASTAGSIAAARVAVAKSTDSETIASRNPFIASFSVGRIFNPSEKTHSDGLEHPAEVRLFNQLRVRQIEVVRNGIVASIV